MKCSRTGKNGYATREQALRRSAAVLREHGYARVYECEFCRKFHITKQPLRMT